jgi:hypothetical protein
MLKKSRILKPEDVFKEESAFVGTKIHVFERTGVKLASWLSGKKLAFWLSCFTGQLGPVV